MRDVLNSQNVMPSCKVTMTEMKNLYEALRDKSIEALQSEIVEIRASPATPQEKANLEDKLKEIYEPQVIFYQDAQNLTIVRGADPFNNLLVRNKSFQGIEIKSDPSTGNFIPKLAYNVLFDFSKPFLFDWSNNVSEATLNNSRYQVLGADETLISSTLRHIENFIKSRKLLRNWIHQKYVYDLGLIILALPMAFILCDSLSKLFNQIFDNNLLRNLSYIYVFILVVLIYRILVGYTKWVWPKIENPDNSVSKLQRGIWGTFFAGIMINYIADILKLAFNF